MEKAWRRRHDALAGLRSSPARVMDRRVHAYVRRRLHAPESLNAIARALFDILQALPPGAAPSCRQSLRRLAGRALRQVLAVDALATVSPSMQKPHLDLRYAIAQLPRLHAAVLIGRKRGLRGPALARAAKVPRALIDTYYSQAYVMIRCKA